MIKITKIREHRLNFTKDDKHYSIQDVGEIYEPCVRIICKEDREYFKLLPLDGFYLSDFDKDWKFGMTYKQFSLDKIIEFLD